MNAPGVSKRAAPPDGETAYTCGHPSADDVNVRRFAPVQRSDGSKSSGNDARSVFALAHTRVALPDRASPTHTDQGVTVNAKSGTGGPPLPGNRKYAMCVPSGDQRG